MLRILWRDYASSFKGPAPRASTVAGEVHLAIGKPIGTVPPLGLGLSHRARAFVKLAEICLDPR